MHSNYNTQRVYPFYNYACPNYYYYPARSIQNGFSCFIPQPIFPPTSSPLGNYGAAQMYVHERLYQTYGNYTVANARHRYIKETEPIAMKEIQPEESIDKMNGGSIANRLVNTVIEEHLQPIGLEGCEDVHNNQWWKVNITKKVEKNNIEPCREVSIVRADKVYVSGTITRSSVNTVAPTVESEEKKIIIYKKEDDNLSSQPVSEEIFHLINGSKTVNISEMKISTKHSQSTQISDISVAEKPTQTDKDTKFVVDKENNSKKNSNQSLIVNNQCKEILAKFALNETSNEYINTALLKVNTNCGYHGLGRDLNITVQFVMKELHCIDVPVNYLSLKLTPRQKQNIAMLIIDEINKLNVPDQAWAPLCRMVITSLNDNFKDYFRQKNKNKKNGKNRDINNSWLWLVELANNV